MNALLNRVLVLALILVSGNGQGYAADVAAAAALPPGAWPVARTQPILDKTLIVRLAPNLSALDSGERVAVAKLLEVGQLTQHLYEEMLHHQAARLRRDLTLADAGADTHAAARTLSTLYRLFNGPIATTLDNDRAPIAAVDPLVPGKNVYPWGVKKPEIEGYLAAHPSEAATVLDLRSVVRRADAASLHLDLATLTQHPELDLLQPGLADRLRARVARPSAEEFYAVPYAVAYADTLLRMYRLMNDAATAIQVKDAEFAGYLRLRARDLLTNDYESGDAAWVTGAFGNLNAQIGAYETYDDELFGLKAWPGLSLMLRDGPRTEELRAAISGLQDMENALPYQPHRKVREAIPVGIYDVIADFGQCRGDNTATILPNDREHARRYGRTILLRRNIMADIGIVAAARTVWETAVDAKHYTDFDAQGDFYWTLWHEIGHYLGPDRDRQNRELGAVLGEVSSTFEELKADLVSSFVAPVLKKRGFYDATRLRGVLASGILRVLLKSRPRPDQNYEVMELMQFNWFLDWGLLAYDSASKKLTIHYERYDAAVMSLLEQVIAIQLAGDRAAANRFIAKWTTWDDRHAALAAALRASETSRFRLVRYAALGE